MSILTLKSYAFSYLVNSTNAQREAAYDAALVAIKDATPSTIRFVETRVGSAMNVTITYVSNT